jgi:TolA-binding protein
MRNGSLVSKWRMSGKMAKDKTTRSDRSSNGTLKTIISLIVICGAVAASTIFILTQTNAANNCAEKNKIEISHVKEKLDDKVQDMQEDLDKIDVRQERMDLRQEKMDTKIDDIKETLQELAKPK